MRAALFPRLIDRFGISIGVSWRFVRIRLVHLGSAPARSSPSQQPTGGAICIYLFCRYEHIYPSRLIIYIPDLRMTRSSDLKDLVSL